MGRITREVRTDDINGLPFSDGEVIDFALDGKAYRIELNKRNAETMRRRLALYVEHASPQGDTPSPNARRHAPEEVRAMRRWALDNGYTIRPMGRIPYDIQNAYRREVG